MIQFKRGKTATWKKLKTPLAAGQPGYDKDKHKLKIGDGEKHWTELPYVSGLSAEEIFNSESTAKAKYAIDHEDTTIITYGTKSPDKNTVGQIYLQYYDAEPEVDYVVSAGINKGWTYQKWKSGIAKCFKSFEFTTSLQAPLGENSLYQNSTSMEKFEYPFTFKATPSEVASIQSPGGLVWLATSKGLNTKTHTASYCVISVDKLNSATYKISLQVEGFWK